MEDSVFFRERVASNALVVREAPKFDLESYIANYSGRTRIERLVLIGSTSTYLAADAMRMAIREVREGLDFNLYLKLVEAFQKMLPDDPLALVDMEWVNAKMKFSKAQTDKLETELKQYRNNMIKESIRMAYEDLGNHFFETGDYPEAYKAFYRMREQRSSASHEVDGYLRSVFVTIFQKSWHAVQTQIAKVEPPSLKGDDAAKLDPIIAVCSGLAYMSTGQYREAARGFLRTSYSYVSSGEMAGIHFPTKLITGNDVAVYGGLCALASMDRPDLQKNVLANAEFRQFLELEPHVRRAVSLFCGSKYSACLEVLEQYRVDYLLDLYLQPCLRDLYTKIREKSIIQYFIPFSCVTLDEMAKAFRTSEGVSIEDELTEMIQSGMLNARIDLVDRLLVAPTTDQRHALHASALETAASYERTLRLRLLRLNMQSEGLVVKAPPRGKLGPDGSFGDLREMIS